MLTEVSLASAFCPAMRRKFNVHARDLLITDLPSAASLESAAAVIVAGIRDHQPPDPVIGIGFGKTRFLLLDGNNRACVLAALGARIALLELSCDADADRILELELKNAIPHFPHRDFLSGHKPLLQLGREAYEAFGSCGHLTVADVLRRGLGIRGL